MKTTLILLLAWLVSYGVQAEPNNVFPQPLQAPGLENVFKVSERVYSGSSPETPQAFAELQKRGVKTIISVDGAKPDVETAKKFGLRYVHLPFGYDGIPATNALKLIKAATTLPQPVYVHCHHGKHRGPAAVAIICVGLEHWTTEQGIRWMKAAGTAANYNGLYRSVEQFHAPTTHELAKVSTSFPQQAQVSPLVDAMVEIDQRFGHLKSIEEAGYKAPASHPDLSPAHEALLLQETFKELLRGDSLSKQSPDFVLKMRDAEVAAAGFVRALNETTDLAGKNTAFQRIVDSCSSCHKAHRN